MQGEKIERKEGGGRRKKKGPEDIYTNGPKLCHFMSCCSQKARVKM